MRLGPLLLVLTLGACTGSGEPSADNIRDALAQAGHRGAAKAEKLACKFGSERPGYVCDYRAPACNRFTGACGAARPGTGRFLYAGGRWQLVEDMTRETAPDPVTQPLPGIAVVTPAARATPAPVATRTPMPAPVRTPAPPPELSRREQRLIDRWADANSRCRGGSGDEDTTWRACGERDRLSAQLEKRGLCYGRPDDFGYQRNWRPCE